MGAEYRIVVRAPDGAWKDVPGLEWRSEAEALSRDQATSAVWLQLQPASAWLVCFHAGAAVREVRFAASLAAWELNKGEGMPFENVEALALWLRKWRLKKKPLTQKDGKALVDAFTGKAPRRKPAARRTR